MANPQVGANGSINVSSFVKLDATSSDVVIQATDGTAPVFGVAQEFSNTAPIPGAVTSIAATAGQAIRVYSDTELCYVQSGSGGWTNGDLLMPSTNGIGITATAGNYYGAQALSTVTGSALGQVQVRFGKI